MIVLMRDRKCADPSKEARAKIAKGGKDEALACHGVGICGGRADDTGRFRRLHAGEEMVPVFRRRAQPALRREQPRQGGDVYAAAEGGQEMEYLRLVSTHEGRLLARG